MILVERVTKTYRDSGVAVEALRNISFDVADGEFVAVMGPSGSGKSTLMHLLGGLDTPTEGDIVIDGNATTDMSDRELTLLRRRHIGFVFQSFSLVPVLTAHQNVALPAALAGTRPHDTRNAAAAALEAVGLSHRTNAHPSSLSGGEQQRVAIARALVNEPRLLIADEPTGNLDHDTGTQILTLLRNLNTAGRTIILATHDPTAATFARRVLSLRDGEVIKDSRLERDKDTTIRFTVD